MRLNSSMIVGFGDFLGSTVRVTTAEISARGSHWFESWAEAVQGASSKVLLSQADTLMERVKSTQEETGEFIDLLAVSYLIPAIVLYQSQGNPVAAREDYDFYRSLIASHSEATST